MRRIISIVMATALCTVAFAQDLDSLRKAQGWDDAPITIKEFMTFCPTPPMGWNSWNKFGCDVSEKLLMETADAMVASGLKDAGYEYIVVDDCWQVSRDADGNIVCDPERFPHGMKYVADYIHSLGLKFGIYSCVGTRTCGGRPASLGHEYQDALFYARTGVDYLKYDYCYKQETNGKTAYRLMNHALRMTGRPIVFSMCEWGHNKPWEWAKGTGHLWRTTGDIRASWGENEGYNHSILDIIDLNKDLYPYAGPGHWNDPDMLEVGNGNLTYAENVSHFTMWCMMAAPLMCGNDLRDMPAEVLYILSNKEVIAIDQDAKGIQGHVAIPLGDREIWIKELSGNDWAVCFLNRGEKEWNLDFNWTDIAEIRDAGTTFTVRDLWLHKEIGKTTKNVVSTIPAHGVLMTRLSPEVIPTRRRGK